MTESEWATSEAIIDMLHFIKDKTSDRKLRLFACAVARLRLFYRGMSTSFGPVIYMAEQVADGLSLPESRPKVSSGEDYAILYPSAFEAALTMCHFKFYTGLEG